MQSISQKLLPSFVIIFVALSTLRCAQIETNENAEGLANSSQLTSHTAKTFYRPMTDNSVFSLLLAEFSLRRGQSQKAAQLYFDQAKETQDPQLAAHAARLAHTLELTDIAKQSSELWLSLTPNNTEASSINIIASMDNHDQAKLYSLLEPQVKSPNSKVFTHLALNAKSDYQRWLLLSTFNQLLQQDQQSANLWMAVAQINYQLKQQEQASQAITKSLSIDNDNLDAIILNAQIHQHIKNHRSVKTLKSYLKKNKYSAQNSHKILAALTQSDPEFVVNTINDQIRDNPQTHLLIHLAKANIALNHLRNADIILQQLLLSPGYQTESHFLLGLIKNKQNNPTQSLAHFYAAQEDDFLVPATQALIATLIQQNNTQSIPSIFIKAREKAQKPSDSLHLFLLEASLYQQNNQFEKALNSYSKALIFFPDNKQVLYNRALLFFQMKKNKDGINDLQYILDKKPNYAPALNALAYHYIMQDNQLEKAQSLIEKAIAIAPNNAEFLDTQGWLYFVQKQYQQAEPLLIKAYELNDDPSIASHLIEVFWVQEKKAEAFNIWKASSIAYPDSSILHETITRLNIDTHMMRNLDLLNNTTTN